MSRGTRVADRRRFKGFNKLGDKQTCLSPIFHTSTYLDTENLHVILVREVNLVRLY